MGDDNGALEFMPDGWVIGPGGEHLGRIDETGHVRTFAGELLGRLDDQGYVRSRFGSVLGRIDGHDNDPAATRRQLWQMLTEADATE